jgi:pimeloyl-ACP methyl ester carboxylesterase
MIIAATIISGILLLSGCRTTPAPAGDLAVSAGAYEVNGVSYPAEVGTLTAPENRNDPASREIEIPVIRILSTGENPAEPVFLFAGGPGDPNIWKHPPVWLLEHHDIIMVGYRGVDGSVSLDTPEYVKVLRSLVTLTGEDIEKLGKAASADLAKLEEQGVDLDGYTIIELIDDMEAVREGFGYTAVNLYAASYGTRLTYIYSLRYPKSIHRSLMYAVNPPGRFVWQAEMIDKQIRYYGDLWKNDPGAVAKSPDTVKTMQNVLESLPREWNGLKIFPYRVKYATNFMLVHTDDAARVFDAYLAAEQGDYSGLAFLSVAVYDAIATGPTWGDYFTTGSVDIDPEVDYEAMANPPGLFFGSPAIGIFAAVEYFDRPMTNIPEKYRKLQKVAVETLMVNGSIDFACPVDNARELLPYLRNGELVVLAEMGHTKDVTGKQPEAFHHLVETFYLEGKVDDSNFEYEPVNFAPEVTLQQMAQQVFAQK